MWPWIPAFAGMTMRERWALAHLLCASVSLWFDLLLNPRHAVLPRRGRDRRRGDRHALAHRSGKVAPRQPGGEIAGVEGIARADGVDHRHLRCRGMEPFAVAPGGRATRALLDHDGRTRLGLAGEPARRGLDIGLAREGAAFDLVQ